MQDLHVTEILPQMITLTEAYIQVKKKNTIKRYYAPFKMFKHFRYGNNLRKEATLKCPTEISVKIVKPELK